jgi:hypothetical protein
MLRQQGDNTLIIYQSCHAIVKQDDSHYMINLALVLSENMTVTFVDIVQLIRSQLQYQKNEQFQER